MSVKHIVCLSVHLAGWFSLLLSVSVFPYMKTHSLSSLTQILSTFLPDPSFGLRCVCLCTEIHWPLLLPYNSYRNKLTDEKLVRLSGIAKVEETGWSMLVLKDLSLEPPHLSIEVSETAQLGKALRVHISLTNTLMVALSKCTMVLEGSGLINRQIAEDLGTLMSGDTVHIQVDLYPSKAGPRQLQVLISSSEVKEIKGYKDIFVATAEAS